MELKFVDIDDYRKQVKHLFVTAFPREERPPMWMLTRRCRQGKARFRAVVDSGRFVGLTYVIGDDRVKTLMFLAIIGKRWWIRLCNIKKGESRVSGSEAVSEYRAP